MSKMWTCLLEQHVALVDKLCFSWTMWQRW